MITKGRQLPASMFIKHLDNDHFFDLLGSSPHPTIYWASAANPCPDFCQFAIATASGGMVLQEAQGQWTVVFPQGQGDIAAVDWLSPTVAITGSQLGEVRLWDTRIHAASREPRIQHPITINHVRSIGANVIVVAGLQNEVISSQLSPAYNWANNHSFVPMTSATAREPAPSTQHSITPDSPPIATSTQTTFPLVLMFTKI